MNHVSVLSRKRRLHIRPHSRRPVARCGYYNMNMPSASPTSVFDKLTRQLSRLPGIGKRSAERIAFHLLKAPREEVDALAQALRDFKRDLKICSTCGHASESDPCPICANPERDHSLVLVVEQPSDVASIEQLGMYQGVYHVLMGRIEPLAGVGPGEINVQGLMDRIRQGKIREVILGTNPTLEGDGTAMFLADQLAQQGITVTRLARGLPTGTTLGHASKAVLADALHGRQGVEDVQGRTRPAKATITGPAVNSCMNSWIIIAFRSI